MRREVCAFVVRKHLKKGFLADFYMSAHVIMKCINQVAERIYKALQTIVSLFRNKFHKFNNKVAQMLEFSFRMALTYIKVCFSYKSHDFDLYTSHI